MANAETNWIDFYISLTPVAQTGIWAGVALASLLLLRKPLLQLGEVLTLRIKDGDKISTPWITLEGRQNRERKVVEQVTENLRREIKSSEAKQSGSLSAAKEGEIDELLEKVSSRFIDLIFPASSFDTDSREDVKVSLYFTDWVNASDFLNEVYISAVEGGIRSMPPWTYGRYWQLRNKRTGSYISKNRRGSKIDNRPFADLGVRPGDLLVAERIR
ncbi:hypothetical protein [Ruegeria jejuensis]|uniref:hypothetical protein n=1 Tax=Ruegeria jejuensis TaxID=3233338 RepID=UPI00355BF221